MALLGHRSFAGAWLWRAVPGSPHRRRKTLDAWATKPSALAKVTLSDNIDMVVDVARRVAERGPVALAGASLGGTTITGVGNTFSELVGRLKYISGWSCVERSSPIEYMAEPEFADNLMGPLAVLNVGDPAELGVGRANYRTAGPELLTLLKTSMMAEGTDEQFGARLARLAGLMGSMTGCSGVDAGTRFRLDCGTVWLRVTTGILGRLGR